MLSAEGAWRTSEEPEQEVMERLLVLTPSGDAGGSGDECGSSGDVEVG